MVSKSRGGAETGSRLGPFPQVPCGALTDIFDTSVLLVAVEWGAIGPMETRGL